MAANGETKKKTSRARKSGNPARRATAQQGPTPADQWVTNTAPTGVIEDVQLPSGNVARVKRVGAEAFLASGLMPDELTALVEKSIHSKKGLPPKKVEEALSDPRKIGQMLEMIDRVVCYAVVAPTVVMPPACVVEVDGQECGEYDKDSVAIHHDIHYKNFHECVLGERKPGVLYVDIVDMEDKNFIVNFAVGGTRDLATFRAELGASVARLDAGQELEVAPI